MRHSKPDKNEIDGDMLIRRRNKMPTIARRTRRRSKTRRRRSQDKEAEPGKETEAKRDAHCSLKA